jgi:hypothetical protein
MQTIPEIPLVESLPLTLWAARGGLSPLRADSV